MGSDGDAQRPTARRVRRAGVLALALAAVVAITASATVILTRPDPDPAATPVVAQAWPSTSIQGLDLAFDHPPSWTTRPFDQLVGHLTFRGALVSNTDRPFHLQQRGHPAFETTVWDMSQLPPGGVAISIEDLEGGFIAPDQHLPDTRLPLALTGVRQGTGGRYDLPFVLKGRPLNVRVWFATPAKRRDRRIAEAIVASIRPIRRPIRRSSLPPIAQMPPVRIRRGAALHVAAPGALSAAVDGFESLWVLERSGGRWQVLRLAPDTGAVQQRFDAPQIDATSGGDGIVIGDGYVWVAGAKEGGGAAIERIDPATNRSDVFAAAGRRVDGVAFDDGGRMWAAIRQGGTGGGEVAQVDPGTGYILNRTTYRAEWSDGVVAAQGTAWVLERGIERGGEVGGALAQVVPGRVPLVSIGGTFASPVSDGTTIWTPYYGDPIDVNLAHGIARVDPTTGAVVDAWRTDAIGNDMAVGLDGGIWFLGEHRLERLDPWDGTTRVMAHLDRTPIFIAPAQGGIWVGTREGSLTWFATKPLPGQQVGAAGGPDGPTAVPSAPDG